MLKKILYIILIILLINTFTVTCYATPVEVTKDNLTETLAKFMESGTDMENYQITVEDENIKMQVNGKEYILNYNLADKPTFTYTLHVTNDMTYDDFQNEAGNLILPMIGYMAVANIQGVELEDVVAYFLFSFLANADFSQTENPEQVEDVIKYVTDIYSEKKTISDSSDLNSYSLTVECKNKEETSCDLVSILEINLDADFSQLKGYAEKSGMNLGVTENNADYVIRLKVGQKCNIISNEKITGHSTLGSGKIDFDEEYTYMIGVEPGEVMGYLYFGNNAVSKSIYVIIEENPNQETLEPLSIEINVQQSDDKEKELNSKNPKGNNTIYEGSKTTSDKELPKAGINKALIFLVVVILVILSIIFKNKINEYKEVK